MEPHKLLLPHELEHLLSVGAWPRTNLEANRQNNRPLVHVSRIRVFAPEEQAIFLYAPPFRTVAQLRDLGERFWQSPDSAPTEIEFASTLLIADFGLGSDAPIALDYRHDPDEPSVIRLCWGVPHPNHWVPIAPTFSRFAQLLGLRSTA